MKFLASISGFFARLFHTSSPDYHLARAKKAAKRYKEHIHEHQCLIEAHRSNHDAAKAIDLAHQNTTKAAKTFSRCCSTSWLVALSNETERGVLLSQADEFGKLASSAWQSRKSARHRATSFIFEVVWIMTQLHLHQNDQGAGPQDAVASLKKILQIPAGAEGETGIENDWEVLDIDLLRAFQSQDVLGLTTGLAIELATGESKKYEEDGLRKELMKRVQRAAKS